MATHLSAWEGIKAGGLLPWGAIISPIAFTNKGDQCGLQERCGCSTLIVEDGIRVTIRYIQICLLRVCRTLYTDKQLSKYISHHWHSTKEPGTIYWKNVILGPRPLSLDIF